MTNVLKRWSALLLSSGLLLLLSASTAHAQQVSVNAVSTEVAVQGDTLQATFKIEVKNGDEAAVTNLFVFFEDDTYIAIGDVAAGATVVSDPTSRTIDLSTRPPSRSQTLQVTLKFTQDGAQVEKAWTLSLQLPEAE